MLEFCWRHHNAADSFLSPPCPAPPRPTPPKLGFLDSPHAIPTRHTKPGEARHTKPGEMGGGHTRDGNTVVVHLAGLLEPELQLKLLAQGHVGARVRGVQGNAASQGRLRGLQLPHLLREGGHAEGVLPHLAGAVLHRGGGGRAELR